MIYMRYNFGCLVYDFIVYTMFGPFSYLWKMELTAPLEEQEYLANPWGQFPILSLKQLESSIRTRSRCRVASCWPPVP